mmetsp:Transcript_45797/g.147481  ORF Transcript_45797/g.147481 Transcript_45797/m.147481 type:complete len:229 (-) Transcript_45797:1278-1964(-)
MLTAAAVAAAVAVAAAGAAPRPASLAVSRRRGRLLGVRPSPVRMQPPRPALVHTGPLPRRPGRGRRVHLGSRLLVADPVALADPVAVAVAVADPVAVAPPSRHASRPGLVRRREPARWCARPVYGLCGDADHARALRRRIADGSCRPQRGRRGGRGGLRGAGIRAIPGGHARGGAAGRARREGDGGGGGVRALPRLAADVRADCLRLVPGEPLLRRGRVARVPPVVEV